MTETDQRIRRIVVVSNTLGMSADASGFPLIFSGVALFSQKSHGGTHKAPNSPSNSGPPESATANAGLVASHQEVGLNIPVKHTEASPPRAAQREVWNLCEVRDQLHWDYDNADWRLSGDIRQRVGVSLCVARPS